jgi:transcriptional regulator with XRE-family HTH domain
LRFLNFSLNRGIRVDGDDPRLLLARRLRALREEHWPGMKITQPQLAQALGDSKPLSAPLISSWESQTSPAIPPLSRLNAYAALFATPRSFGADGPRRISSQDMSPEERAVEEELRQELFALRNRALTAAHAKGAPGQEGLGVSARPNLPSSSLSSGPWFFPDRGRISIVCAQWPRDMLDRIPYTDTNDPDYIELLTYSELDSLVMSYGHLRAANPASQVEYFRSGLLPPENYSAHLVSLGGTDWNVVTASLLRQLKLPVRQVAHWNEQGGVFFEVDGDAGTTQHHPVLEKIGDREVLLEDVALFARTVNPFNRARTATICSGMYGRGTYGVVRALTDPEFRERNTGYLESRFSNSPSYCLVVRVTVDNNKTMTPDWTDERTRLFEWSGSVDGR